MKYKKQELIKNFNQPGSVLVISSYPEKGVKHSGKVCAVGGFTKNTIESFKFHPAKNRELRKFVVLTVIIDREEVYIEDGILVCRIFRRNKPLSYLNLLKTIRNFNQIKDILFEFEFASYGNTITTAIFPLILLISRIWGKKITLVSHQVVLDLRELTGHLGWRKSDVRIKLFNFLLKVFFFLLVLPSQKIVVLEEMLKQRLVTAVGMSDKIVVIPHGIDRRITIVNKNKAREKLGIKRNELILLYFGYLTWYKGVDFLVRVFAKNNIKVDNKQVKLIIAGGESATQKTKFHYQQFVKKVYSLSRMSKNITITGFVEEKNIPLCFAAADLVILPYRTFMSSSGPLSLTCSFKKPFIMSSHLDDYFKSSDFSIALEETDIKKEDLLFSLQRAAFIKKIKTTLHRKRLTELTKFSETLGKKRDFLILAHHYAQILDSDKFETVFKIAPQMLISS